MYVYAVYGVCIYIYISSYYTIPQFRPFYRDPRWRRFQPGFCRNNIARPALAVTQFNLLGPRIGRAPFLLALVTSPPPPPSRLPSPYFLSFRAPHNRFHRGQYRIFPRPSTGITPFFFIPASSFIFHTLRAFLFFHLVFSRQLSRHSTFSSCCEAARTRCVPIDIWGSYLNKFPKKKIKNYSKDCVIRMTLRRLKDLKPYCDRGS